MGSEGAVAEVLDLVLLGIGEVGDIVEGILDGRCIACHNVLTAGNLEIAIDHLVLQTVALAPVDRLVLGGEVVTRDIANAIGEEVVAHITTVRIVDDLALAGVGDGDLGAFRQAGVGRGGPLVGLFDAVGEGDAVGGFPI